MAATCGWERRAWTEQFADTVRDWSGVNQRGGRMLSVFELLAARTLDLDLAAYFLARSSRGASFMVGARPEGRARPR